MAQQMSSNNYPSWVTAQRPSLNRPSPTKLPYTGIVYTISDSNGSAYTSSFDNNDTLNHQYGVNIVTLLKVQKF